jgi:hypothetical protein
MATGNSLNANGSGLAKYDGAGSWSTTTTTIHDVLIGAASNAITNVAPSATSGVALISQGAAADPAFGTVVVAGGGTGAVTLTGLLIGNGTSAVTAVAVTQHDVLVGAASNSVTSVAPSATSGVPLISQGAAADPAFGTVVVAGGGTGAVTFNINGAVFSNTTTTGALAAATLTSGQLLIGGTTTPAAATLSAGTGVSIVNGNNSITINATGGGVTWTVVTGTSQAAAVNNGYFTNNAGLVTVTLPTTAAVGTVQRVSGYGAGGWKIAQNASQQIFFGITSTTAGVSGSVASTQQYDTIELVCNVANTDWVVQSSVGNLTIV